MSFYTDYLLSRRKIISGLGAFISVPLISGLFSGAMAESDLWEKRLKEMVREIKPVEGQVSIELPKLASHQNAVQVKIIVDSPMTATDYVETITLMSGRNTEPVLAEFRLSPLCGKAEICTFLRLKENQEIMALAKTSDGRFFIGRRQAQIALSREF